MQECTTREKYSSFLIQVTSLISNCMKFSNVGLKKFRTKGKLITLESTTVYLYKSEQSILCLFGTLCKGKSGLNFQVLDKRHQHGCI